MDVIPLRRLGPLLVGLAALAGVATAQMPPPPELPSGWTPKALVRTEADIVVAANALAVQAGVEILAAGGAAIDAAIAVQLVLNLVEPQSSGIGGGAFLLGYDATLRRVTMYDGRETAPMAATEALFLDAGGKRMDFVQAVIGGRSVGVPGVLRMLQVAHREHGRLPWAALFASAIRLADYGFALSPRLHAALQGANLALAADPVTGPYFFQANGAPKPVGTVLVNPEFAATLRTLAIHGAEAFYTGPIAADIVAKVRSHPTNPGTMELADLAGYDVRKRAPLCDWYRGMWKICGTNMPSSGGAAVLMSLGILENFDLAALPPNSAAAVHLVTEAYRLVYADRAAYMGDSDFVCVPVAGLLDKSYLRERARHIDPARSMGVPAAGAPRGCDTRHTSMPSRESGTSHIAIVDRDGNAISMTTTIESGFGSYQMVRGFLLNNELTDFDFSPRDATGAPAANRVEPGKRPRSSMAPTFVFDRYGRLYAVLGSPGGSAIIQFVTKTLLGILDWKLDIQRAIDLGNFGAQLTPDIALERGTTMQALAPALQALGHTTRIVDINSGLHGIVRGANTEAMNPIVAFFRPYRGWVGGADPRREGSAGGH
ncbi:MAG: gamma-glutamyltransferase [Casimicrobiaceae bacterium]